jgi:hypothetical protein
MQPASKVLSKNYLAKKGFALLFQSLTNLSQNNKNTITRLCKPKYTRYHKGVLQNKLCLNIFDHTKKIVSNEN